MKSERRRPRARLMLLSLVALVGMSGFASAQSVDSEEDFAPPLKAVSKSERSALEGQKDPKKRLTVALGLMESRLKNAEAESSNGYYERTLIELGAFAALMSDMLDHLKRVDRGTNKDFNNLKKFEMTLRSFAPRVELIRREAPEGTQEYLKSILKQVRDTRSKAMEPLFGNDVVPNQKN